MKSLAELQAEFEKAKAENNFTLMGTLDAEIKKMQAQSLPKSTPKVGKIVLASKTTLASQTDAFTKATGGSVIMNGVGVKEGDYVFTTANEETFIAMKDIVANTGTVYVLHFAKGVLKSADGLTNKSFGLGDKDPQFVVDYGTISALDPNTSYDVKINAKGRITSCTLALQSGVMEHN